VKLGQRFSALAARLIEATLSGYGQRIDYSDYPYFDNNYWVFSRDQDSVLEFLDRGLQKIFAATPGYLLMAGGDTFVCQLPEYKYLRKQPGDLENLKTNLQVSLQFYNHLKAASNKRSSLNNQFEEVAIPSHCPACGGEWSQSNTGENDLKCPYCGHTRFISTSTTEAWKAAPPIPSAVPSEAETPEYMNKMSKGSRLLQSGCLLIFGLVWILISTFIIGSIALDFIQDFRVNSLLISEGVQTQAKITDLTVDHDSEDGNTYYVSYQYQVPVNGDFTTHRGRQTVSSDLYATLENGGKIEIVYAVFQPFVSDIKANLTPNPYIQIFRFFCLIGIGILFLLIGVAVTAGGLAGYWGKNREARLEQG
jgi:hypothetical protein